MTKWRKRIGVEGIEKVLELLVRSALRIGVVKKRSLKKTIVDTTAEPKAIAYPTDGRLYLRGIKELVLFAKNQNIQLRQTYSRLAPRASRMASRLMHARKFKKAKLR